MAECIGELSDLLERDRTILYICGLKGMEDGIDATFKERAGSDGTSWTSFHALREAGRILVETY